MLKSDLVAALVKRKGVTDAQAAAVIDTVFADMTTALCAGQGIEIRGFGAFRVKDYGGYQGRNPKTGGRST